MTNEEKKRCKEIIDATCVMANSIVDFEEKSIDHPGIQSFICNMIISIGEVFEKDVDDDVAESIIDNVKARRRGLHLFRLPEIFLGKELFIAEMIRLIGWEASRKFE